MKKNRTKTHDFKISTRFAKRFLGAIIVVSMFLVLSCVDGLEQNTWITISSYITAILAAKALEVVYDIEIELKRRAKLERQRMQEMQRRGHINFNYDLVQMSKEQRSPNADKVVLIPFSDKKVS